jgi:hypothetical protein
MSADCPGSTCWSAHAVHFAFANDDVRVLAIGAHVDAIQARAGDGDLRIGGVDARELTALEHAYANADPALRDEQRELPIVQARHVKVAVAREPQLGAADVHLGASVVADPEVVAAGDGVIESCRRPCVRLGFGCDEQLAGNVGHTAYAARQVFLRGRDRACHRESGKRTSRRPCTRHSNCTQVHRLLLFLRTFARRAVPSANCPEARHREGAWVRQRGHPRVR